MRAISSAFNGTVKANEYRPFSVHSRRSRWRFVSKNSWSPYCTVVQAGSIEFTLTKPLRLVDRIDPGASLETFARTRLSRFRIFFSASYGSTPPTVNEMAVGQRCMLKRACPAKVNRECAVAAVAERGAA